MTAHETAHEAPRPPGADARPPDPARVPRAAREPAVHRLYARVAWSTLDGLPLVGPRRALAVESQAITLCRRLDVEPMEVRARPDRVDLLVRFKPAHAVADVAEAVKRGTAAGLRRSGSPARWGRGVALATVAPDGVRHLMRRMALLTDVEGPVAPGRMPAEQAPPDRPARRAIR